MAEFLISYYRLIFALLVIIIASLAFYAGLLEGRAQNNNSIIFSCSEEVLNSLRIPLQNNLNSASADQIKTSTESASFENTVEKGIYAGSKNGTKYYTPGCSGLDRIKPENLIWFQSEEDATLQGYSPANC